MTVSAVIVTRGDVDLGPVLDSLPVGWEVVVWDNSAGLDVGVYGRYAAIEKAAGDLIYVQDDDCIAADPGRLHSELLALGRQAIVMNMPERFRRHYPDSGLVGFGAIFPRHLPEVAFERFARTHYHPAGDAPWGGFLLRAHPTFRRTCDVPFTALSTRMQLDLPYIDREFASDASRMWRQPTHVGERTEMLKLARQARDAE